MARIVHPSGDWDFDPVNGIITMRGVQMKLRLEPKSERRLTWACNQTSYTRVSRYLSIFTFHGSYDNPAREYLDEHVHIPLPCWLSVPGVEMRGLWCSIDRFQGSPWINMMGCSVNVSSRKSAV